MTEPEPEYRIVLEEVYSGHREVVMQGIWYQGCWADLRTRAGQNRLGAFITARLHDFKARAAVAFARRESHEPGCDLGLPVIARQCSCSPHREDRP